MPCLGQWMLCGMYPFAMFGTNFRYGTLVEVCILSKTVWNFARANPGQKSRFQKLSKVVDKMEITRPEYCEYSETWPEINNCKDGSPASEGNLKTSNIRSSWRKRQLGTSLLTLVQHHGKWPGWLGKARGFRVFFFHQPSPRFERCGGCSCKYRYGGLELENQDFPPLLCRKDVRRG